jgi:hypothetical protein
MDWMYTCLLDQILKCVVYILLENGYLKELSLAQLVDVDVRLDPEPQVQVLVEANFCMFLLNLKALLCWSRFLNKYTQFLRRTSI